MFKEKLPDKLLRQVGEEARPMVAACYVRMKEIADTRQPGVPLVIPYKEIALPSEAQIDKRASTVWAVLYMVTFHRLMVLFGVLAFPIAILICIYKALMWVVGHF
jgi:hypothetical protein